MAKTKGQYGNLVNVTSLGITMYTQPVMSSDIKHGKDNCC